MTSADPGGQVADRVHALVVGIKDYPRWKTAKRVGLDDEAVAFARWLRWCGVPAANISLLLSPTRTDLPVELSCLGDPNGADRIRDVLTDLLEANGEVLWVYWAGHGYQHQEELRVLTSGARPDLATNISFNKLTACCADQRVQGFQQQVFIVDACRGSAQLIAPGQIEPWADLLGTDRSHAQTILYACARGEEARHSAEQQGGLFSKLVLAELESRLPAFAAAPDSDSLVTAVETKARQDKELPAPAMLTIKSEHESEARIFPVGPADATPINQRDLHAFAVVNWNPLSRNELCGSEAVCRLDVGWGLDRTRVRAVLADHADADLVFELNLVEQTIADAANRLLPRREWRCVPADRPRPTDLTQVLAYSGKGERKPAVVIRLQCVGPVHRDHPASEAVAHWVEAIDQAAPGADIVIQVAAESSVDSMIAAEQTSRRLRSARHGAECRWPVFVRNRPGTAPGKPSVLSPGPAPTIGAVLGHLRHEAAIRGLDRPVWYPQQANDFAGGDADSWPSTDVVAAVLDATESVQKADPVIEAGLLCAVRDLAPQWHLPLLRAYARATPGPIWSAAAAVAAVYDDDLDAWLAAAGGEIGPDLVSEPKDSWLCDAMCLAHLRCGKVATASRWSEQDVSPGVADLCSWVRNHLDSELTMADLARLAWPAVTAAARIKQGIDFDPAGAPTRVWRSAGLWAAVAARPVDTTTVRVLLDIPAYLEVLWAAVDEAVDQEPVLADDVMTIRRLLRHVAMRERDST